MVVGDTGRSRAVNFIERSGKCVETYFRHVRSLFGTMVPGTWYVMCPSVIQNTYSSFARLRKKQSRKTAKIRTAPVQLPVYV